jgi:PTS system galactitol-specific IIB component
MENKVKIFIGCGSGIATSNMAKAKVSSILEDASIPFAITTGNIAEMNSVESKYDVLMVTTSATESLSKPVIPVFGLLSGINASECAQKIIDACGEVLEGRE